MLRILTTAAMLLCMVASHARQGVKVMPVGEGYSKTSVNTAVFRNSPMAVWGDRQFIAYYAPDGTLMLGCRNLADSVWTVNPTQYKGNVADAHNVISLGIDGRGYLHVAFDHHGHPLRYARSTAPGALTLGKLQKMTGRDESDVTYPEFYPMPGGDLLAVYRSGASGRGNLVMNRYDSKRKKWHRIHDRLIDGEDARNAYWQLYVDPEGTIHLSWVWRETWMVETNHDLCYARSADGGRTWQRSDGSPQPTPITAANAEYAMRIPQNSELINQTSMTADTAGHPYIATYWRDANSDVPQYRVVWNDGAGWHASTVGHRTEPFSLAGGGTKMIPIARPRIVADGNRAWYIFRDAERGSRVSIAMTDDLASGNWTVTDLTDYSVDAWEPSLDVSRINRDGVIDLFVQTAHQGDGETTVEAEPTMVSVIEIDPNRLTGWPTAAEVVDILTRVNDTWQASHPDPGIAFWDNAAYHTGNMEAYRLTGNDRWLDYSRRWADQNQWKGAKSDNKEEWKYATYGEGDDYVMFGDWQVCFQTYADIFNVDGNPDHIARAREVMEYEMSTPQTDYWWWADGLYMVMPVMTKLYNITGNPLYLDKLYEYWQYADNLMYDPEACLYYRDGKYIYPKHKSANGLKDFWARGDGWVVAALAKVIADLPADRPEREVYIRRFREMADAVAACQQPGGYWTRSLLDPEHAPGPETSGTAFFTYGLLWGLNNGLLDEARFRPVVFRAWDYLANTALQPDNTVGYVQPIGERAIPGQTVDSRSVTNFGTGAFLLAASELARYLSNL